MLISLPRPAPAPMRASGGQFLPGHQEVAVAGDVDHRAVRAQQRRGHGCRDAVTHRARGRCELGAAMVLQPGIARVTMQPGAEIARTIGVDRVGRRQPLHRLDDLRHVQRRHGRRLVVGFVVGMRRGCPAGPARHAGRGDDGRQRLAGHGRSALQQASRQRRHGPTLRRRHACAPGAAPAAAPPSGCSRRWSFRPGERRSPGPGRPRARAPPAWD